MQMKNPTDTAIKVAELNILIRPGRSAEIPDGYCMPRAGTNGDPIRPIIAMLAPQLEPADERLVAAYRANKLTDGLVAEPPPVRTAADYQADGMSPAVAELVASGNAASAPKVPKRTVGTGYEDVAGTLPRK